MNCDSHKNEEDRFSEMIATADNDVSQPDREFLAGLKTDSMRRFLETASPPRISKRNLIMAKIRKFAPSALAAGLIGAIGVAIVLLSNGESGIAWADVQKHIEQAKCIKMKVEVTTSDGRKSHGRQVMATGGLVRQDISMKIDQQTMDMVVIVNYDKGIILSLLKDQKLAIPTKLTDMPKAMRDKMVKEKDQLAQLKRMVRNAEKELGDKTIDGVKAKGFQVREDQMVMDIWVDAKTALPIRIEGEMTVSKTKVVLSDIEFVEKVDPDLFSVEPPKGYKVKPQQTFSMAPGGIEDFTSLLDIWTQIKDGAFPDTIESQQFSMDIRTYVRQFTNTGEPSKESQLLVEKLGKIDPQQLVRVTMLMQFNKTFHYQGKGVKLGDKDTAVLWYKPKGQDKYVVMYGDLHVERVLKKDLPQDSNKKAN
jgi:outer membrane lipoprotein-sorting protein